MAAAVVGTSEKSLIFTSLRSNNTALHPTVVFSASLCQCLAAPGEAPLINLSSLSGLKNDHSLALDYLLTLK